MKEKKRKKGKERYYSFVDLLSVSYEISLFAGLSLGVMLPFHMEKPEN